VFLSILNVFIFSSIATLTPFLLAQIFTTGNITNLINLILALIFFRFINLILFYYDPVLRLQTSRSIENSASKFFLTVDPIHHTFRSSGQILAKSARGSNAFDTLLDLLTFEILNIIGMIIGMLVAFSTVNPVLAFWVFIVLIFISAFNIFLFISRAKLFKPFRIKAEDLSKAAYLETLQQTSYIRAVFGTTEQLKKVTKLQLKSIATAGIIWRLSGYIVTVCQIILLVSVIPISSVLLNQANLDKTIALSLVLSYIQVLNRINFLGNNLGRLISAFEDINDLFDFIRGFGKQTFPVLEAENIFQAKGITPVASQHPLERGTS
jgi:ABC-type multidrug transport system fused ATPase/permease subunit